VDILDGTFPGSSLFSAPFPFTTVDPLPVLDPFPKSDPGERGVLRPSSGGWSTAGGTVGGGKGE